VEERVVQFRIGVMILSAILVAVVLMTLFGELPNLFQDTITVKIKVPDAPGVTRGTPIRKSGILIGRVRKVELDDAGGVLITAEIDADRKPAKDDIPRIRQSVLGDSTIDFESPD
jgi:phospholipid/cholesterol/gamma-HCH transport system substrate-binding protein